ncbi:MAG TPA: HAD-IA family hydrolase [Telmatospirillum sp.]|nr:HAD-IA family hydrolase [Telmatospirillum sp.]
MTALARLAVFDVDGTLIDSQHNIVAAMALAFQAQGLDDPGAEAVRRIIGLSLVEAVACLAPDLGPAKHESIALSYRDAFFVLRSRPDHSEPLFPGAVEALDRLEADGWLLGIATGKSRRGLDAMIERHGLQGRFMTLQTADGNPGKPHPAMVLQAMDAAAVGPDVTVMIGDTSFDMQMARAARARAAGVTWGYHPSSELLTAGAETMIDEFSALPSALEMLLGRP